MDPSAAPPPPHGLAQQAKTLYVGNLDQSVTEELILALFGQIGPVKGCKIIRSGDNGGGSDPYCFVEFAHHQAAVSALESMNNRLCMGKMMRVNWATSSSHNGSAAAPAANGQPGQPNHHGGHANHAPAANTHQNKPDTSSHHHIFVGDLCPDIETETLRTAFACFGPISDCRVVRDSASNKSKGYGFVSFLQKPDAQKAIEEMNRSFLGTRAIRTNWATRKPPSNGQHHNNSGSFSGGGGIGGIPSRGENGHERKALTYDDVFLQSSETNCTVYCGGMINGDENQIRRAFTPFGRIMEVRYFRDKGYAFIRYDNKESACNAIVALHGTEVNAHVIKCSWGKETGGMGAGGHAHVSAGLVNPALGVAAANAATGANLMALQAGHYNGGAHPAAPAPGLIGAPGDSFNVLTAAAHQQQVAALQQQQQQQQQAQVQQFYQQQQQYMYMYNPQYVGQMQQQLYAAAMAAAAANSVPQQPNLNYAAAAYQQQPPPQQQPPQPGPQ